MQCIDGETKDCVWSMVKKSVCLSCKITIGTYRWTKCSQWVTSSKNSSKSHNKDQKRHAATAAAKLLQSCLTLRDPIDGSPLGSSVPGILQARILEWVAISFSNAWKWKVKVKSLSCVWLVATPWIAAYRAPLPMEFSRQEYWSGVPSPSPTLCTTL